MLKRFISCTFNDVNAQDKKNIFAESIFSCFTWEESVKDVCTNALVCILAKDWLGNKLFNGATFDKLPATDFDKEGIIKTVSTDEQN